MMAKWFYPGLLLFVAFTVMPAGSQWRQVVAGYLALTAGVIGAHARQRQK